MARYGILGDAHGNREALRAALEILARRTVERVLCTGDLVGYNAAPNECVAIVEARGVESIAGNHDLIGIRSLGLDRCVDKAAHALRQTRAALSPRSRDMLAALPRTLVFEDRFVLVHGGVDDVQEYLLTPGQIRDNAKRLGTVCPEAAVCFFGHTHEQRVYEVDGETVAEIPARAVVPLRRDRIYFVNPGSVDASRKAGEKRAECAIFDSTLLTVEFLRVAYDDQASEARARAAGYRMNSVEEWMYAFRRRVRNRMRKILKR